MEKVSKLGIVKGVTEIAVSMGVSVVIGNLIKETTPLNANKFQKVMVSIGGYTLGGLLGDMAAQRVIKQVDELADRFKQAINPNQADLVVYEKTDEGPTDEKSDENAA